MNCPEFVKEGESREKNVEEYMKIFDDDIPKEMINRVLHILRKREKKTGKQEKNIRHKNSRVAHGFIVFRTTRKSGRQQTQNKI